MYTIDKLDEVVELKDVPQSDVGAPLPLVIANDYCLQLAYLVSERSSAWTGTSVTIADPTSEGELVAILKFNNPFVHMFGMPNDEAFSGHPLSSRGLSSYAAFEIRNSSWIRQLERMNSVHPRHVPSRFLSNKHFVFAFHDSTFECVAASFAVEQLRGSLRSAAQQMLQTLKGL